MPRAPSSGLSSLLLMAGLAFAASTTFVTAITDSQPLETAAAVDPWLSASDPHSTVSDSATDSLSCSASEAESLCLPPCSLQMQNTANRSTQCLYYLKESHKEEVCGPDVATERRRDVLHGLRMRHCCEHAVDTALPEAAFHDGTTCRRLLTALLEADDLARRLSCSHADLLIRYDCSQNYSISHDCKHCKEAYRRWVCSSLVPHYTRSGERVRPCLSVCEDVEQQCPYLLPDQTLSPGEAAHPTPQYAGEPAFLCLDPNIPETGKQKLKSSRGDEDCCYRHCGSPGRGAAVQEYIEEGGRRYLDILSVCEHCPGRPPNSTLAPSKGGATSQTLNKVFILWTALMTLLQTDRLISLLVMCEYSVRTMYWFLNERRHSCL